MKQAVATDKAQSAKGLLSQAIICGNLIFTAGFIHVTPEGKLVEGTTEEKFKQVMSNLIEVLEASNSSLNDVLKVTIYLTDISILPELNNLYKSYFSEPMPAREAVCVMALPLGASIEVSAIAMATS